MKITISLSFLILVTAVTAFAQGPYKKGDTLIVNAFAGGCVKGTVVGTDPAYNVMIEEGTYKGSTTYINANRVGECKQGGAAGPDVNAVQPAGNGRLGVGTRVDVYYSPGRPRGRGKIVEVRSAQYKVSFDGCESSFDSWEDMPRVQAEAKIGTDDPDVKYTLGKWSTIVVGQSRFVVAWGKGAGLQIDPDGGYTWFQDGGIPPVRGKWTTYSKLDGADKFNIDFEDGIQITDAKGLPWKVVRSKGPKGEDTVTINRLCYGAIRQTGYRVR